jgi:hypothetical protein
MHQMQMIPLISYQDNQTEYTVEERDRVDYQKSPDSLNNLDWSITPLCETDRGKGSGPERPRKRKKKYGFNAIDMDENRAANIKDPSDFSNELSEKDIFITTHSQPLTLFDKRKPEYQKQLIIDAKGA